MPIPNFSRYGGIAARARGGSCIGRSISDAERKMLSKRSRRISYGIGGALMASTIVTAHERRKRNM